MLRNMAKKRGLNRRGQESLMWTVIFELLLVAMALLLMLHLVYDLANNNLVFKQYYSKEISLTLAVLYAAPGNVNYNYDIDEFSSKRFYFQIKDSLVTIGDSRKQIKEPFG